MAKRLICLIVSVLMVVSLLPMGAFADETTYVATVYDADGSVVGSYETLKTAYAATPDGGSMVLSADVSGEQLGASTNKAVTLDLSGYTISRSTGSVIDCSKGTLTIKDSSGDANGMVKNTSGTAIKLTGGTVVLESGTLESTSTYAVALSSGALTVNGGAVIAASSSTCIVYYTGGTLTINDGLFTVVGRTSSVTSSDVTSGAIVNAGSSATSSEDVQVAISGGVFQMYRPLLGTSINVEITGGYFLSKYSLSNYIPEGYAYSTSESVTYLGNTYSGYYQVAHSNFTLTVTADDSTETTSYYTSLVQATNAAISAYSSNSSAEITIKLENDYTTGKVPVESAVKLTLDLNGNTLTSTDNGAFKINSEDADVTIEDSSTEGTGIVTTTNESSSTTGLFQVVNGSLTITGGSYNQGTGSSMFVVGASGDVTVSAGYFTSDPSDYVDTDYHAVSTGDSTYGYAVLAEGYYMVDPYKSDSTYTYPEETGKVFAGWYTDDTCATVYTATSGVAYAKFVDADVLSVKVGVMAGTDGDAGYYWRFATGLDTLNYNAAGFEAYLNGSEEKIAFSKISFYTYYTVTSQNYTFKGTDFGSCGKYLATALYSSTDTPSTCKVRAYWVTLDGTTVYGEYANLTYSEGTYLLSGSSN